MKSIKSLLVPFVWVLLLSTLSIHSLKAQENATAQDLLTEVRKASDIAFDKHFEEDEKRDWLTKMSSFVMSLRNYDHLPNHVSCIVGIRNSLFDQHFEEEEQREWVRKMIESIICTPVCDNTIPNKINTIIESMKKNYKWPDEEEGWAWARQEIAGLI